MLIIFTFSFSNMVSQLYFQTEVRCISSLLSRSDTLPSSTEIIGEKKKQESIKILCEKYASFEELAQTDFLTKTSSLFVYLKTESQKTSSTVCALPSPVTFPAQSVMK